MAQALLPLLIQVLWLFPPPELPVRTRLHENLWNDQRRIRCSPHLETAHPEERKGAFLKKKTQEFLEVEEEVSRLSPS